MNKLLAIAAVMLSLASGTATSQVLAFLVNCRTGTSVTGMFIYVGTYQYGGQTFEKVFNSYCPPSIQVR